MIKISSESLDIVDNKEICVHDAVFNGVMFDYENKIVTFEADDNFDGNKIMLSFHNVIELKMESYEPWGKSPHIFELCLEKYYNETLSSDTQDGKEFAQKYSENEISVHEYIKVILTLISGDTLNIVCEYIIYDEL